ncbi:hypothetical protein N0V90_004501 [Kalmusia sp. IMI 367209]|nr:hypothetical protein N0V90_004501 [Kalmusia sp. IMI 367209]
MATAVDDAKVAHEREEKKIEDVGEKKAGSDSELEANATDYDGPEARRILSKVDYRLVPVLSLLYLVAFIDRSNIGNAKVAGLTTDLNMHGLQYNTAVTLFFVPYTLLEVPTGRFFLGVTESGFFPAATFLLTLWYRRYEVQRRMAVFYVAASLSGAFSGLLAYAIQKLDGHSGLDGWQWIFMIEGLVPVALALVIWKVLPDSPETASFLNQTERDFLVKRLAEETGSGHGRVTNQDKMEKKFVIAGLSDWKIWAAVVIFWGNTVGVYGFTATVPTVINQLGYSAANAQLLTIPIYVFASIMTIIFAWWSDHIQTRSPFIIAGFAIAACGFIAQLAIPHPKYPGLTYGFLFPCRGRPLLPLHYPRFVDREFARPVKQTRGRYGVAD